MRCQTLYSGIKPAMEQRTRGIHKQGTNAGGAISDEMAMLESVTDYTVNKLIDEISHVVAAEPDDVEDQIMPAVMVTMAASPMILTVPEPYVDMGEEELAVNASPQKVLEGIVPSAGIVDNEGTLVASQPQLEGA